MLFYKVVEIKQKSFLKGIMTALDLQNAINKWANFGWTLDRITSGETQGFAGGKDVFLLIFKKDIVIPEGFYLMINNQPMGPLTAMEVSNLSQNRLFNPNTLACKKGLDGWHPVNMVLPDLVDAVFM